MVAMLSRRSGVTDPGYSRSETVRSDSSIGVDFEVLAKFFETAGAAFSGSGRGPQFLHRPHAERDDRVNDHRFGDLQAPANDPIGAPSARTRTRVVAHAGFGCDIGQFHRKRRVGGKKPY